jgi:uncharacterized protein (TIGR02246 family)
MAPDTPMMIAPVDATAAPPDEAVEALCDLYQQLMDGWNKGSGEAFAAPFDDELDFVAFDGARFRRRDELARFHDPLFRTHLRGTRLVGRVLDLRFVSEDVAVFHAYGGTIPRGRTVPAPGRDSIQTLVAVRRGGPWRLVAFQNTRIRPIGRNICGSLLWLVSDRLWRWCLPRGAGRSGCPALGGRLAVRASRSRLVERKHGGWIGGQP